MIIEFAGTSYDWDIDRMTVDEWREIKRKYALTPKMFEVAMAEADPDAMTCLYWSMLRQAGQTGVLLGDQLSFPLVPLLDAVFAAQKKEEEEEAAAAAEPANPTVPAPSPPASPSPPVQPSPAPAQLAQEGAAPPTVS